MRRRISSSHLLCSVALALLAACQTSETSGPSSQTEQPAGKLSAPVDISYELMAEPRLGQALEIRISARSLQPDQEITVQVTPAAGLSLSSPAVFIARTPRLDEGQLAPVVVTPLVEGRSFLNVIATVNVNGQPLQKAIAIPIQVGPVAQQLNETRRDANGNPIRSMPAEENTD